ncbi:MAG TPA: histidine kinase [Chitinophagaceae bacterium]|nr:histidine kinase [Chitinophagaceae bacterium]
MKQTLYLICLLLASIIAEGQNMDSLFNELASRPNDKKLLFEIAKQYRGGSNDSVLIFANKIIQVATKENDLEFLAKAYNEYGIHYLYNNDYQMSNQYYRKAIGYAIKWGDPLYISKLYGNLSQNLIFDNQLKEANDTLQLGLEVLEKLDIHSIERKKQYTDILGYRAIMYKEAGLIHEALTDNFTILQELKKIPTITKEDINYNYTNIGSCLLILKDYDNAIPYFKRSLDTVKKDYNTIFNNRANMFQIATTYLEQNKFDSANFWCNRIGENLKEEDNHLVGFYQLKSQISLRSKVYDSATYFITKAIEVSQQRDQLEGVNLGYSVLGEILLQKGQYNEAKKYLEQCLPFYQNSLKESIEILRLLSTVYEKLGNDKKAILTFKKYDSIQNILRGEEQIGYAIAQDIKYQSSLKEEKIKDQQLLLEKNKSRSSQLLFAFLFSIVVIIAIFLLVRQRSRKKTLQIENEKINLKYNLIKGKVLPHFSGNVLNNIAYLFESNQQKAGIDYLVKYSELNKDLLRTAELSSWSLQEELAFLRNYINLEKLRYRSKLQFNVNMDENVDTQVQVPILITHTFCKNSIEHGIMSVNGKGSLTVDINEEGQRLEIVITDDGIGIEEAKRRNIHNTGHGLEILKKQFEISNKKNTDPIMFDILPNQHTSGTVVKISIPKHYNFTI